MLGEGIEMNRDKVKLIFLCEQKILEELGVKECREKVWSISVGRIWRHGEGEVMTLKITGPFIMMKVRETALKSGHGSWPYEML